MYTDADEDVAASLEDGTGSTIITLIFTVAGVMHFAIGKIIQKMHSSNFKEDEYNTTSQVEQGELICTFPRFFPRNRTVRINIRTYIRVLQF